MERREWSLYKLNTLLRRAIRETFPERCWVQAELSEVRENASGHCYLELVEKNTISGQLVAKARGMIWNTTYRMLKPYFESETGQPFCQGLKVLIEVTPEFHELYGYSLTISDIDPVYTLGDMARRRAEIIRRLEEDGIIDMNKELPWPVLPQRIAVISSPTAAGYGDFTDQLFRNRRGYRFYIRLFPAVMQGIQSEESIIGALNAIFRVSDLFDVVVIIRGGGATSELSCFDSYLLASHIAQFPLPVITGIGHDRDETVIDRVASVRVKTPTAAAEFLIGRVEEADSFRLGCQEEIVTRIKERLRKETERIDGFTALLPRRAASILTEKKYRLDYLRQLLARLIRGNIQEEESRLMRFTLQLPRLMDRELQEQQYRLSRWEEQWKQTLRLKLDTERKRLEHLEQVVRLTSLQHMLDKGYSLTLKNSRVVKDVNELKKGDRITTLLSTGEIDSEII